MNKPLLVVITGSAASGKSTLARKLATNIHFPLISRDELKEGLINTLNIAHAQLEKSVDLEVYETFFETIELLTSKGISVLAEAAFQDKLWRPKLLNLSASASLRIVICRTNPDLLKSRFISRLSNNADRQRYHGDQLVNSSKEQLVALTENYKPLNIDAPTLQVDTTENYYPAMEEIISFIRQ